MKVNNKFLICAMLVLMLFLCINASSATEPLNDELGADVSNDTLSASGDTIVVDANGGGDYTTISSAVSAATGGETILIKNGEYTETSKIDIGTKKLTFTGESNDKVIIKSGDNDLFYTTGTGYSVVMSGLTFKDISMTGARTPLFMGGSGDVTLNDCTFENCASRFGALRIFTSGSVTVDGCKFLDVKSSTGSYSSAIDFGGTSTADYTIKNSIIDGSSIASTNTASYIFGAIYSEKSAGTVILDNVTICNCNLVSASGLISTKGNMNIKNSKLINNYVYRDLAIAGLIFVNGAKTVNIESSIIANNTQPNQILSANSASATYNLNYNNIQNNSYKTAFINSQNGAYNLDYNYWGSNDGPTDVNVTDYAIYENGEFKLKSGNPLEKQIPEIKDETDVPGITIFVSPSGDDANNGSSEESAVKTIAHAVELAALNEKATIYLLAGEYTTGAIEVNNASLDIIGKDDVTVHGTGAFIFSVSGENLTWNIKNINFDGINSKDANSAALVLTTANGDFTIADCTFKNINAKYGAMVLGNKDGNVNVANCIIDGVTGSVGQSATICINDQTTADFNNVSIINSGLSESVAAATPSAYLRSVLYINNNYATVTLTNSRISENYGPMYGGLIESRSKLTITNTEISNNVVNTSTNGANGGEYLIWASNDNTDIDISQSIIANNVIVKSGKGLFYNQKGKINVAYSVITENDVDKFIGSSGTITANNNWWGTNDQPDAKVDNWVIMNVEMTDNSDLGDNNQVTFAIDFNHVKTASGNIEELTGGKLPKDSYDVSVSAKTGEITPASVVVNKGKVLTQTFNVTNNTDVVTFACDGAEVDVALVVPYFGIIYVDTTGSDDNDGSIDAPVATVAKAIELASKAKASKEIIINEGTYVGNGYHITTDLTVTGVGEVILDANDEGRLFYMGYGDTAGKIVLSNLVLTNANGFGAAVYSNANELILDNVAIVNNKASNQLIKSNGKLTIKDSEITGSASGNVIEQTGSGDIIINNTVFKDNSIADSTSVYGVIYMSSGSGNLIVDKSQFINNTARQGVIKGNNNYNIIVKDSEFINNTNLASYGGAIYAYGPSLDVTGSAFINNNAYRDGGAIYVGWKTTATVDKSLFINNTAGLTYEGDAIYNGNKLSVNNSALLTNAKHHLIYNDGDDNVVYAQNNWWGTNDNPKDLVSSGYYEDDWNDEVPCGEVDVSNWVTMNATYAPSYAYIGDDATITATFSNINVADGIPVTFTSTSGKLNTIAYSVGGQASTIYTIDANDEAITATSGKAAIDMPIASPFTTNVVTNDTFYIFFDESGLLKDTVPYDELIFKGQFSDLAAGYVIITKPVKITGDKAVLHNIGFVIASENVALDNMTLAANTSLGDLISVTESNVDLTNLFIFYRVGDDEAVAINVKGTSTITDVNILNNNIYFESHVNDDEGYATAINLEDVEDVVVDNNTMLASVPALYVETYDLSYFMMGLVYVNPIRIYEGSGVEFTNNIVDVTVNDCSASFPTTQAMYIVGSEDVLIKGNKFTMIDTATPLGTSIYLYAVECGFSDDISFIENNFNISTTGGQSGAGSAYALQVATSSVTIIGNNITCDSNGPNLGIFSPYGFGRAKDMDIQNNFLNISGYAAGSGEFALISGIEIQTGYATIYNNTIYVQNKGDYGDKYPVSAISAVQYSASTLSFDIQDNDVFTNGKYAVDIRYPVKSATVTGNYLSANTLRGDNAVYVKSGTTVVVKDNYPINIVTNDTFFEFFDENGILRDSVTFDELVFCGQFSNLTDLIVFNRPITITGNDTVLDNIAVRIAADDVKLSGFTLNANNEFATNNDAAIYATGSDIELDDVVVNYNAPSEAEAIAIYANLANNFKLVNSEINYVSTNPGDKHNYGLEVRDSTNVLIENNVINAVLPAVDVNYDYLGYGIDTDLVLAVGIQSCENINFTSNVVNVESSVGLGYYSTVDTIMVDSTNNLLINFNNITQIDNTTKDAVRYYNTVDLYAVTAVVENNKIIVQTTAGVEGSGSAYPIQLTGPFTVTINNNTLVAASKGPTLGIFAANSWTVPGPSDLTVTDNIIEVIGYAGKTSYALVSGIETQVGSSRIYNNSIYTFNIADYDDSNNIYGISFAQSGTPGSYDIKDNYVYTEGKYAVYFNGASNTNVTDNYLVAAELYGDDAVVIASGDNNIIENNEPNAVIVTNDTFYKYFDDEGILKDSITYDILIFKGAFSNLTDLIVLNRPIEINGGGAVLENIAVRIAADNVEVYDLILNADKEFATNNGAAIYATGSNITIALVEVNYAAPSEAEAIAIYANLVDNFVLVNSEINYASTNPGDKHNYGLEVRDSTNVLIKHNTINAVLPAVPVSWGGSGIDQDLVLAVGIQSGENINFTSNVVDVKTNGGIGSYPTIDAVMIYGSNNVLVNLNNISHVDNTTEDSSRYYYSLDLYSVVGTVEDNNIIVNTTASVDRAGTAYPIQLTGPFTVTIENNNLTAISKGPTHAIYASNWAGPADLTVTNNNIEVIGYATVGNYALVSGIEAEIDVLKAYNNTIAVMNGAEYNDTNQVYGISMVSPYITGVASADIKDNRIVVDGKYAVYYIKAVDTNVTGNTLYAHELKADHAAVIDGGDNNVISDNLPGKAVIDVTANAVWTGTNETIVVNVRDGTTGTVTVKLNNKTYVLDLVDGSATKEIPAEDLVDGVNNLTATYNGPDFDDNTVSKTFYVLDGVVTQENYMYYFNQANSGKFFDYVPEGATLDFQGSIINPNQNVKIWFNVNKPVNIVTTTNDAYIDLNTTAGSLTGDNPGNRFTVSYGGSGSNMTGINFHNTQLWIANTHNVVLDNISNVIEDQRVGSGVGATSVRENCTYVTVKNSYFYTRNNGGSSSLVMAWADYCTFDNNYIVVEGNVGNMIYLTTFNVNIPSGVVANVHNKITNNRIYGPNSASAICWALVLSGSDNLIENNTIEYKGVGITTQFGSSVSPNNTYRNNKMLNGSSMSVLPDSILYNNYVSGALTVGARSIAYNNTVGGKLNVAQGAKVYDNTVGNGLATTGTDAIIENNTIKGAVTINKVRTTFIGNKVIGKVTVSANNNVIKENVINTTDAYAVDLGSKTGNNVTDNLLFAKELTGDAAVKFTNKNNVVKDNHPPLCPDMSIDVGRVWIGNDNVVKVTLTDKFGTVYTGSVNFTINNKTFTVDLVDGKAECNLSAAVLIAGENEVVADYVSDNVFYNSTSISATFIVLDGVVTQDTYLLYFNQDDNGKFFDYVPEGATLDFQGKIINPDQAIIVQMNVNKPVNIISTTKDAYVDLNTTAGSLLGESPGNSFAITKGGSGTNVTGINFHNTQLWFSNTHDVILDNISNVVEDQRVGSGVGATSIRDNSTNVLLKNSYFYTRNNGGSTTFTMSWATNCTIDNCTVKAEGNVGNLIYLNIFNVVGAPSGVPLNNNNTVSNNRIYGKEGSGISVGLMVEGQGNLIVNNTLYKSSISTSFGGYNPANNIYVGNTMTQGSGLTAQAYSIIYGNNVTGALSTGKGSVAHDNLVGGKLTVGQDAIAYDNTVGNGLATGGTNAVIENNTIKGAVTINKVGTTFVGNDVNGTVTVSANNNIIKENTITTTGNYAVDLGAKTGNTVTDNYLVAKVYKGDVAVKYTNANNVVENNTPTANIGIVDGAAWIGNNATITVNVPNTNGSVTITFNGKSQTVDIVDGVATAEFAADNLTAGEYDVAATYNGPEYAPKTVDSIFYIADGVITNATYKYYFDKNGNLAAYVPDGATLDFQGLFLGKYPVYINKAANVISSTGDALFDSGATYAGNAINSFNIVAGGDNTNITGLNFINYCLYIKGASNVTVDSISIVANKRGVGSGTGFLSIHTGAYNTLVKNGYFENGGTGSSLLVLGKGGAYATFDHNIFNITGSSGNILSANQFVGSGAAPEHVSYTNNVLYNIQPGSPFCYAMTVSGSGNLLENNTIYHNGSGILNQYGATSSGNVYRNNTVYGNTNFNPSANSIVENNRIFATTNIAANTVAVDNIFTTVAISGTGTVFTDNIVSGTVTVKGNNNVFEENIITSTGDYAVDLGSTTGNNVTDNILYAKEFIGDAAVKYTGENLVKHNYPLLSVLVVEAADIVVGQTATIDVSFNEEVDGIVEVIVDGKKYSVDIANGKGQLNVSGLAANTYNVGVYFDGNIAFFATENSTKFTVKKQIIEGEITVGDAKVGEEVPVYISLPGATGNISIIVDGVETIVKLDENSTVSYSIPAVTAGNHSLVAIYWGDNTYDVLYSFGTFVVNKSETPISVNVTPAKVGEDANVTVELPGATGNVSVIVDGVENVIPLDENGTASYTIPAITAGDHSVVVIYSGDDAHDAAYKATSLSVEVTATEFANITVSGDLTISAVLVDEQGKPIANALITYTVNNVAGNVTTGNDGSFVIVGENGALVTIDYAGNETLLATSTSIKFDNIASQRLATQFNVTAGTSIATYAVDFGAGERGANYRFKLTDSEGKPIVNATVEFAYKTVYFNRTTDEDGCVLLGISTQFAGEYLCALSYLGDETHNATFVPFSFNVQKKSMTISAAAKSYKASAKTKKYTVTLKTQKGVDGKTYLKAGKKVTLKLNGKTYTAKTNDKGQATFSLKITKIGKFDAKINFAGDNTYEAASKTVKITIK